jgi:predicted pyridoxine 5'-phosphate oxidase superfamily flavin-nucleotide-binding protein
VFVGGVVVLEEVVEFLVRACSRYMCVLGTSSLDGRPNVVLIGYIKFFEGKLLLADPYLTKTKENIIKNPKVAITCWDPETFDGYQLKGRASIDTSRYYEAVMEDFMDKPWKPRAAVVVDVEEIYTVKPGEYGKKII